MTPATVHNPDRFMIDLRQILSQGRKRIGLLLDAGAPNASKVKGAGELGEADTPLIPDVAGLTSAVLATLRPA